MTFHYWCRQGAVESATRLIGDRPPTFPAPLTLGTAAKTFIEGDAKTLGAAATSHGIMVRLVGAELASASAAKLVSQI